jgi:UDP-N-acetylmuramyl pentapeptide phosphotransferase/UDP-N-acetylglucosamine-1-phosphate transferase
MALLACSASVAAALASWTLLRSGLVAFTSESSPKERYRKSELQLIPRIGGVAIAFGFVVSWILGFSILDQVNGVLRSLLPCSSMHVSPRPLGRPPSAWGQDKVIGQLTVATVRGDAVHIHHRLLDRDHSTRRAVFYLYLLCLTHSLAALAVFWTHGHALPLVAAALFIGINLAWALSGNWQGVVQRPEASRASL